MKRIRVGVSVSAILMVLASAGCQALRREPAQAKPAEHKTEKKEEKEKDEAADRAIRLIKTVRKIDKAVEVAKAADKHYVQLWSHQKRTEYAKAKEQYERAQAKVQRLEKLLEEWKALQPETPAATAKRLEALDEGPKKITKAKEVAKKLRQKALDIDLEFKAGPPPVTGPAGTAPPAKKAKKEKDKSEKALPRPFDD